MTVVALLWAGLVIGVSFLATPVKFHAESITLPVAVDVGRATFHLLAKVEWVLAAVTVVTVLATDISDGAVWAGLVVVGLILATQAGYLLPRLDTRVAAVIAGEPTEPSRLHIAFAGLEAVKVAALITVGIAAMT